MSDYTKNNEKVEALLQEALTLTRAERHLFIQKLFFAYIKHDNKILIPMLKEAGISAKKIAEALGVDESVIWRDYLTKENKKEVQA